MSGISKGWRVLDVACGTGAVAQQLLQRTGNGGLVVGVDASHTALLLAKKYVRVANFHPVIMRCRKHSLFYGYQRCSITMPV